MKLAEFREISKEIIELRALEKSIDPNVLILTDSTSKKQLDIDQIQEGSLPAICN